MIDEIEFKLPKQWKDWCKSMHLRPAHKHGHDKYNWYYLKGRGYMWRVNCFAEFQRGDTYEDFDRWARCKIDSNSIPKTKQEFKDTVLKLVQQCTND